jgi:hypothetical protein
MRRLAYTTRGGGDERMRMWYILAYLPVILLKKLRNARKTRRDNQKPRLNYRMLDLSTYRVGVYA